ncbi:hypothetical protein KC726_02505 [Candidatus Woesebacteria bacterium]|nr:hypothetical protein [Candidatus Woesebacteria bacterium]
MFLLTLMVFFANVKNMAIKDTYTKLLLAFLLISKNSDVTFTKEIASIFKIVYNQKTRKTLQSLEKHEYIKSVENKSDTYRFTKEGKTYAYLKFPFFRYLESAWDNKWRIISYEIPENKRYLRDRLRREVAGWGLGPWHRSFWLTPHPILSELKLLAEEKKVSEYIQAFEGEHAIGQKETLLEKVWNITKLEKEYKKLFKIWHDILAKDIHKHQKLKEIIEAYTGVLKVDPGLPKELLKNQWIGFEAYSIYNEIKSILLV